MAITGFEIDFLPVGTAEKSGDAILFRYKEDEKYKVILIDGGWDDAVDFWMKSDDGSTKENGSTSETIIKHMRKHYYSEEEKMCIDHIICSHPDRDHIEGLLFLIHRCDGGLNCDVGNVWVNSPDKFDRYYIAVAKNKNDEELECFSEKHALSQELRYQANKVVIDHVWLPLRGGGPDLDIDYVWLPKQGGPVLDYVKAIGPLIIASPSEEFYHDLVYGELKRQKSKGGEVTPDNEGLEDYPKTSLCNESSTVLFGKLMDKQFLLTADAGIEALSRAYDYLKEEHNFQPGDLDLIQIPHHGSHNNVNATTLNNLLGEITNEKRGKAIVSVAKGAKSLPAQSVIDAFEARGYSCESTSGTLKWFKCGDMPERDGCSPPISWVKRSPTS